MAIFVPFSRLRSGARAADLDFARAVDRGGDRVSEQLARALVYVAPRRVDGPTSKDAGSLTKTPTAASVFVTDSDAWRKVKAGVLRGIVVDGSKLRLADAASAIETKRYQKVDSTMSFEKVAPLINRRIFGRDEFFSKAARDDVPRAVVDGAAVAAGREACETISRHLGSALRAHPTDPDLAAAGLAVEAARRALLFPAPADEAYGGVEIEDDQLQSMARAPISQQTGFFKSIAAARDSNLRKAKNTKQMFDITEAMRHLGNAQERARIAAARHPVDDNVRAASRHLAQHMDHLAAMGGSKTDGGRTASGEMRSVPAKSDAIDPSDPEGFRKAMTAVRNRPMRGPLPMY